MHYRLRITGGNQEICITDENVIKKVDIMLFQSDKSANDRSDQLFCGLTICGILNDKSQKETQEIFEWSKKTDKVNVYKTVSVQVFDQKELIRDYYLKEMYCTSYQEKFDEYNETSGSDDGAVGLFVLEMKQRKGAIDTIVVES